MYIRMYSVKNYEKYLQVRRTSYFWASRSIEIFTGPLFRLKLHLLSPILFINPLSKVVSGLAGIVNAAVYKSPPIFTGLEHGNLS